LPEELDLGELGEVCCIGGRRRVNVRGHDFWRWRGVLLCCGGIVGELRLVVVRFSITARVKRNG